ncbi:hypothetical protein [Yoonia sediminilitoris]|nr:hypothetical protein [Yoonia sediminilitoris]
MAQAKAAAWFAAASSRDTEIGGLLWQLRRNSVAAPYNPCVN